MCKWLKDRRIRADDFGFCEGLARESPSSRKIDTPLAISPGSSEVQYRRMMHHRSSASYWPPLRKSIKEHCKAA
jgi:hypothetical protein